MLFDVHRLKEKGTLLIETYLMVPAFQSTCEFRIKAEFYVNAIRHKLMVHSRCLYSLVKIHIVFQYVQKHLRVEYIRLILLFVCQVTTVRTFKVAVAIWEPPDPPSAMSNLPSLSTIVGVIEDKGRLPGAR